MFFHGQNRRFVNHIGQIRAHGAGGGQGNFLKIHILAHVDIFPVHLQHRYPALQIRFVHNNPPVQPAGTLQRRIQHFGPVGGRQDKDPLGGVEAVHFR